MRDNNSLLIQRKFEQTQTQIIPEFNNNLFIQNSIKLPKVLLSSN